MYGNGAQIGIVVAIIHQVLQITPPDLHRAFSAGFVAEGGSTLRSTVECRIAITAVPAAAATLLACAWLVAYRLRQFTLFLN